MVGKRRFFIALLPPAEVQQYANEVKEHFATVYQSKAAQKSPPHVTLQPPFEWEIENLPNLENSLQSFALTQSPIPMILEGYGAFRPRVIYINVLKTPELLNIQKTLALYLESSLGIVDIKSRNRSFSPHLTVGFRDLSKGNFYKAWSEFQDKKVYYDFQVNHLTLLLHNGHRWEINTEFSFGVHDT